MRRRNAILLFCISLQLFSAGCSLWGAKKNPSWKDATSGEQLERLFWQDVKASNWRSVEGRMAPMLVFMTGSSVMDRAAALEYLKSLDLQEFQIGEVETKPAGVDLIVSYVITIKGAADSRALPEASVRVMSVWQQLSKGWVLVAQSAIPTAP